MLTFCHTIRRKSNDVYIYLLLYNYSYELTFVEIFIVLWSGWIVMCFLRVSGNVYLSDIRSDV